MRRTPITLGILSMVFGSLLAVVSAVQLAFSVAGPALFGRMGSLLKSLPQRPGQVDPQLLMARTAEAMRELAPYNDGLLGGKLAFSIALIFIGYGLYKRQRWSRSGALAWGALALLFTFAEAIVRATIILPRTAAIMKDLMVSTADPALLQQMQNAQSTGTLVLTILVFAPFPIVLLALCGRRSAVADFTD
jgi:hypothetical protein